MIKFIMVGLVFCSFLLSSYTANAAPSWIENIFSGSEETEKKEKSEKKHHKDKAHKRKGPPDHAKAHGYRAKFKHYPDADIYENTATGKFFQKRKGTWQPLDEIPSKVDLGSGVTIDLDKAIPEAIRAFKD